MIACEKVKFLSHSLHDTDVFPTKTEDRNTLLLWVSWCTKSQPLYKDIFSWLPHEWLPIVFSAAVCRKEGPGLMASWHSDHYIKPLLAAPVLSVSSPSPHHRYSLYSSFHLIESLPHLAYHLLWQEFFEKTITKCFGANARNINFKDAFLMPPVAL